jgi:cobalt/nickel transport system permease protein
MICEYKRLSQIFKKLLFLNLFIVMIFLVLALQGNMEEAINIYIRTNIIILFNLILFSHSNGFDIVRALNELKFPKQFVSSVYFTLKMIQILTDEFKKIKLTLKSRGFRTNTSMFTYETYGNLFGHIFVKSIIKSNALKDSFSLRGFDGRIYLTANNKLGIFDAILLLCVNLIVVSKVVS